ncbi:hypothetical protein FSP39_007192 [Pinctada imbricata]|uniref:ABC1 atypical kinase-like domain-containing protein n=1 Tax=Pinctada imbricata TaxID=66713 RepID=A0AA89BRG3_PINIB|nr:hypothetical protein FSP39_007192 [Pinctada imbricata]
MQTDPNWANFFYNPETGRLSLLDFGATRKFHAEFVDKYIMIIKAAADMDREGILKWSKDIGYLTGYESKVRGLKWSKDIGYLTGYESKDMIEAHIQAIMILGEAISTDAKFDFGSQNTTGRVMDIIPVMAKDRLSPPPPETYSLHRKMAGSFLICTKLQAKVNCKTIFDDIWNNYQFNNNAIGAVWTED